MGQPAGALGLPVERGIRRRDCSRYPGWPEQIILSVLTVGTVNHRDRAMRKWRQRPHPDVSRVTAVTGLCRTRIHPLFFRFFV